MRLAVAIVLVAITSPALAQKPERGGVPPAEFDRPFGGRLVTVRVDTAEELRKACRWPALLASALGCANWITSSICVITMRSDEAIEAMGYTAEFILRHEIGHCNGWPSDHAGARRWVR